MRKTIAAGIAIMMALAGTGQDAMAGEQAKGAQVIAHRGYWDTPLAVQNSRASLKNALELKVYGSDKTVTYDPMKRTGVCISKLGASKAISIGAYTYALSQLDATTAG